MLLAVLDVAAAGVWVNDPHNGYAQISYTHQQSDTLFLEDGRAAPQTELLHEISPLFSRGRYSGNEASVYLEYGVLPHLELVASLPYRALRNRWTFSGGPLEDILHENSGFGDVSAGLRAGDVGGGYAFSGYVIGRAPLYDNSPEVLRMEAGNADLWDDRVPLGQGTMELDLGLSGGLGTSRFWALAEAGLRVRDRQYSSALPSRLQLGMRPVERLALWTGIDGTLPLTNGKAPDTFTVAYGKGPLVVDRQSFLTPSLGLAVDLVGLSGVTFTAGRTLAGSRFPRLTTLTFGLYSRLRMPWADR